MLIKELFVLVVVRTPLQTGQAPELPEGTGVPVARSLQKKKQVSTTTTTATTQHHNHTATPPQHHQP